MKDVCTEICTRNVRKNCIPIYLISHCFFLYSISRLNHQNNFLNFHLYTESHTNELVKSFLLLSDNQLPQQPSIKTTAIIITLLSTPAPISINYKFTFCVPVKCEWLWEVEWALSLSYSIQEFLFHHLLGGKKNHQNWHSFYPLEKSHVEENLRQVKSMHKGKKGYFRWIRWQLKIIGTCHHTG